MRKPNDTDNPGRLITPESTLPSVVHEVHTYRKRADVTFSPDTITATLYETDTDGIPTSSSILDYGFNALPATMRWLQFLLPIRNPNYAMMARLIGSHYQHNLACNIAHVIFRADPSGADSNYAWNMLFNAAMRTVDLQLRQLMLHPRVYYRIAKMPNTYPAHSQYFTRAEAPNQPISTWATPKSYKYTKALIMYHPDIDSPIPIRMLFCDDHPTTHRTRISYTYIRRNSIHPVRSGLAKLPEHPRPTQKIFQ